ncbi:NAD-dependent epimerase/dehydratase family protein [Candidatus Pelagibacter sp.]|nr:NAD-dependent epimerase/dehydratase family protein [Candidatus Pelagibacter sp.]
MKNIIVVTGGAGFVGSNLIKLLIKKTKFNIISIDDYSTGLKRNHLKTNRVKYIKSNTKNISNILEKYKKRINALFHFGEFSRIYQSFNKMNECINSNSIGSHEVFNFCLSNKIKLIYSATSASIGNKGNDKNLSPYAFTKAKNLELLENLKRWYKFKFEIIYFYNVYGPQQISKGDMATVIGIFESQYKNKEQLTVVRPGTQSRRFTHIFDTIDACYYSWKKNKCRHYSISHKKSYTIVQVAKLFNSKIKFLSPRVGERYASALTSMNLSNKVHKIFGKINLKDYIANIVKNS